MRLSIRHRIGYRFPEPARNVTRVLRLTPRSHEGQHVINWQIDVDVDCILKAGEDGFGNLTHTFTAKGPCEDLAITVVGEIDSFDAAGVVRGSAERMPIDLYLRGTPLTLADDALRRFARDAVPAAGTTLDKLHTLLEAVPDAMTFKSERPDGAGAAEAFAAREGNGRDFAHVYTTCARQLGFAARVTSGYYLCEDQRRGMSHTWSEVFVNGLGWTGFDAAHNVCPQDTHVRLATGLDALAAAKVRGIGAEPVVDDVDMHAPYAGGQGQSQGPGWQRQG